MSLPKAGKRGAEGLVLVLGLCVLLLESLWLAQFKPEAAAAPQQTALYDQHDIHRP